MDLGPLLGAVAVVGGIGALWWGISGRKTGQVTANLMAGLPERHTDVRAMVLAQGAGERIGAPLLDRLGRMARRVTPAGRLDALGKRLVQAGNPRGLDLGQLLAIKAGLAFVGLAFGAFRLAVQPSAGAFVGLLLFAAVGYFVPDVLVNMARTRRFEEARMGAADLIDQLTVTVEAGLGLESAMAQVAGANTGPLAVELARTLQDVRAGLPRTRALKDLAERLDVPEVRQIVLAIAESEKHGLPIAETLRVQAEELRVRRRQRAEEKAMKLPVKIIFPTLLCIMPSLFIVVLGPAVIRIMTTFGS